MGLIISPFLYPFGRRSSGEKGFKLVYDLLFFMRRVVMRGGKHRGKKRLCFETEDEGQVLEWARDYFASARLLLTAGLDRQSSRNSAAGSFCNIKRGTSYRNDNVSVSFEEFKLISIYAMRHIDGESYDEATFERPVL